MNRLTAKPATATVSQLAPEPGWQAVGMCACATGELRCGCGSLLARVVEAGVELKCRRCKRTMVLRVPPASQARGTPAAGEPGSRGRAAVKEAAPARSEEGVPLPPGPAATSRAISRPHPAKQD